MEEIRYHTVAIRTYVFGVRFRSGFRGEMLARQDGMDRYAHNRLLETFRNEYSRTGMVDTSRGRINMWYTDLRNMTGPRWLKQSVSGITRQTLHELGRHYSQYVETEYAKAAGAKPGTKWGEPHYKRYGDRISIPLTITHDNTSGSARFTGDRTMRILKMGDIKLSRPFPVPNYRPKTARLFQTHDRKWRIAIACGVDDPEPCHEMVVTGVDRNIGNISTPDHTIEPPDAIVRRMGNAERTASRAQHAMSRRRGPDGRSRRPGSRRWAKAARRMARQRRRAANIRHTISHKASRVLADHSTHVVLEDLSIHNMTKSAKGTVEIPGRNIPQKSGLNRAILYQNWGTLARLLAYKLAGGIILVAAMHTSQTCSVCGFTDGRNRNGRVFVCMSCRHVDHADRNAARNIEDAGVRKLGRPTRRGRLEPRHAHTIFDLPATPAGSAHAKGRLDAEGSGISLLVNRQAPTSAVWSGTMRLWNDV